MGFERPKIACFICKWAFVEEELAFSGMREIADVSTMRVKCIGGIDPSVIFEIFIRGVDGILLIGCAPSECHFVEGSFNANFMINMLRELLSLADLQPERLQLYWSLPLKEAEITDFLSSFAKQLKEIGSLPISNENILQNLLAAKNVVTDFRSRICIGKKREISEIGNVYGEKISQEEFKVLLSDVIRSEYIRHKILLLTKTKSLSIKELAGLLNIKPALVLRHILNMRQKGLVVLDRIKGTTPLYRAMEV